MDFSYCNICFDLKQLIKVLHCDLQVTIHQGLVEAQADILKAIASFIDNSHIKVTTLSAPQVHALLDHMCARHAGSHSFLTVMKRGTTSARPESFLERGLTHLLQSFLDRLPDHRADINRGSTHPTQLESEVDQIRQDLQAHMINIASNPALMLNFKSEVRDVTTIDLTGDEAIIHYPPLRGNITEDPEDNIKASTEAPGHSTYQRAVHDESFTHKLYRISSCTIYFRFARHPNFIIDH